MLPRSLPENLKTGRGWHASNGGVLCKSWPLQQLMDIIRISGVLVMFSISQDNVARNQTTGACSAVCLDSYAVLFNRCWRRYLPFGSCLEGSLTVLLQVYRQDKTTSFTNRCFSAISKIGLRLNYPWAQAAFKQEVPAYTVTTGAITTDTDTVVWWSRQEEQVLPRHRHGEKPQS